MGLFAEENQTTRQSNGTAMNSDGQTALPLRGLFIVLGVVALGFLLWSTATLWLLVFAGILLAIFLDALAGLVSRAGGVSHRWSLAIVCVALLSVCILSGWYMRPKIVGQAQQLSHELPRQVEKLETFVRSYPIGEWLIVHRPSTEKFLATDAGFAGRLFGFLSTLAGTVAAGLLVVFVGLYAAIDPAIYRDGILRILPARRRDRWREVLTAIRNALLHWLCGRALSMTIVGILTWAGLALLGVPTALTLALIAAALAFIPNLGPVLAVIPALLVGLMQSPATVLWVGALYLGIQTVESYGITPFIQQRAVSIPPALLLTMQVLFGIFAGALGVLLATPITVTVIVAVQMLYIRDVLGDDVTLLGD